MLLALLTCAGGARAQSSGSFPEPAAPAPVAPPTAVAPPAAPASAAPSPLPPPPAPAVPPPAPTTPYAPPASYPAPVLAPASLSTLPPILPYRKGLPVPPGYRVVDRANSGLIIGGGVTFLLAYAAGLGLAASQSFENGTGYTAIPVAGPWAAIGGRSFQCKAPVTTNTVQALQKAINRCVGTAFDEVTTVVFLTADGLVQATGAALFLVGLATGHQELVREDLPKTAVTVLPEGGFALSLWGSF